MLPLFSCASLFY